MSSKCIQFFKNIILKAVIHVKGGHATIPQDSVIDPILDVSATVVSVTMLDGGIGLNVIADSVSIAGPNIQFKKFRKSISFFSASIKNNEKKIEEEEGTTWDIQEKTTEPSPLLRIVVVGSSLLLLRFAEPKRRPPPFCDRLATTENRHNFLLHSFSSVRTHQLWRPSDSSC
ncbi:unnamed protein product [Lactuca saligna]|uniref:Peptidase M20 dimerisation domain-containing protein n=1 Tax=Lactuca saligna TaxID=75948 RepID=A0AA35ZH92_LACSI|nr:unnamed protein product [Lactuca saligna]